MNKTKRLIFFPIIALALSACDMNGTKEISADIANQRVAQALGQSSSTPVASFKAALEADFNLTYSYSDENKILLSENTTEVSASFEMMATNLGDIEKMEAYLTANGNYKSTVYDGLSTSVALDTGFNTSVYYKEKWMYAELGELSVLLGGEEENAKIKVDLTNSLNSLDGNLSILSSELTSEDLSELPDLLETLLGQIKNVKATETKGDLLVTYQITYEDIINALVAYTLKDYPDLSESDIDATREFLMNYYENLIVIKTAKIIVGVSKHGFINLLQLDIDLDYFAEIPTVALVKTSLDLTLNYRSEINSKVKVSFPSDLDEYIDLTHLLTV